MTKEDLARILYEEFSRDAWGNFDPDLLQHVAEETDPEDLSDDDQRDVEGLAEVLERVVERIGICVLDPG